MSISIPCICTCTYALNKYLWGHELFVQPHCQFISSVTIALFPSRTKPIFIQNKAKATKKMTSFIRFRPLSQLPLILANIYFLINTSSQKFASYARPHIFITTKAMWYKEYQNSYYSAKKETCSHYTVVSSSSQISMRLSTT